MQNVIEADRVRVGDVVVWRGKWRGVVDGTCSAGLLVTWFDGVPDLLEWAEVAESVEVGQ